MTGLFSAFAASIIENLRNEGFQFLKVENEDWMADTPFAAIKNEGGVFYAAVVYDATDFSRAFEWRGILADKFTEFSKRTNSRNIIIFNLFSGEELTDEIGGYIDNNSEEYYSQPLYEINYFIPFSSENAVKYNAKQPYDLLGMPNVAVKKRTNIIEFPQKAKNQAPGIVTYILLIINTAVLTLMELNGGSLNVDVLERFGALTRFGVLENGEYYRLFTSMFLHIGITHLVFNNLSLYIFGPRIERYLGRFMFLLIYISSGLVGSAATLAFSDATHAAGASGAIYGLMGAAFALTQITKKNIGGLSFQTMLFFISVGVVMGLFTPNIGNAAHIGGLLCGYAIGVAVAFIGKRRRA